MSIASVIAQLAQDKQDIANAITAKGGTCPPGDGFDDFATNIATISGGGISGGFNVTFKVDNTDYYFGSCGNGGSISAPPQPTKTGKVFVGWSLTDGGEIISFPYTVDEDKNLYAVFTEYECTVDGLGNSDPSTVTFAERGTFPTLEEVTLNGNVFIKFPKMYRKVLKSNLASYSISSSKLDDGYLPYPCFVKEDGVTEMDYILIGKYVCSSTTVANSVDAVGAVQRTNVARPNAKALGTGYQLFDWWMYVYLKDMFLVKSKTLLFGSGDDMHSEYCGVTKLNGAIYIDGAFGSSNIFYFSYKPSKYVTPNNTVPESYNSVNHSFTSTNFDALIKKLNYYPSHPFADAVGEYSTSVGTYSTYYCSGISVIGSNVTFGTPCAMMSGSNFRGLHAVQIDKYGESIAAQAYVRLCYRPIGEQ